MSSSEPPLAVSGVSHSYPGRKALDKVSLKVETGTAYGLLGPNGAGKTTLVRIIAGRLAAQEGSVAVCGKSPLRDAATRGRIGLVPQHLALYDTLSARENLEVFGGLFGMKREAVRDRAVDLLALAGLSDRASARVTELSGGMRRRLNIVAAVMHQPALLLLDEPSVGVDLKALEGVIALIERLKGEGYAILLTTHDMMLAEAVCDRIGILKAGQMLAEDSPAALEQRLFGGHRMVQIELDSPVVADSAVAALGAMGLHPARDERHWQGTCDDAPGLVARLSQLEAMPPVHSYTVTRPGLGEVYTMLTEGGS